LDWAASCELYLHAIDPGGCSQSEANIRQALRMIDAMAPAVCFLDEVEKAFSGVAARPMPA
jgi:hypothetical protein